MHLTLWLVTGITGVCFSRGSVVEGVLYVILLKYNVTFTIIFFGDGLRGDEFISLLQLEKTPGSILIMKFIIVFVGQGREEERIICLSVSVRTTYSILV